MRLFAPIVVLLFPVTLLAQQSPGTNAVGTRAGIPLRPGQHHRPIAGSAARRPGHLPSRRTEGRTGPRPGRLARRSRPGNDQGPDRPVVGDDGAPAGRGVDLHDRGGRRAGARPAQLQRAARRHPLHELGAGARRWVGAVHGPPGAARHGVDDVVPLDQPQGRAPHVRLHPARLRGRYRALPRLLPAPRQRR